MLDVALRLSVEGALGGVAGAYPVGGGCISPAWRIDLDDGSTLLLKTAPAGAPEGMLAAEAHSLGRLAETMTVRVPRVAALREDWLALEWLEPAESSGAEWEELGRSLARLHRNRHDRFGWSDANFIGTLPQSNDWSDSWAEFWRSQRIMPQVERASAVLGPATLRRFDELFVTLEEQLGAASDDGASLLHGDLWHGNVHFTGGGAALIDPSSSYGHREVDLAMAALFGGFPQNFFRSYDDEWPMRTGVDRRRVIYQIYYVLVHVNLFGGAYVAQTRALLERALH